MTTPIQWANLSARERDALCATRIMGWVQDKPQTSFSHPFWLRERPLMPIMVTQWSPTTNPRAAMEVVEAMRGKGFSVLLEGTLSGKWKVHFLGNGRSYSVISESMEDGIAKASLRAVGLEVEG